MTGGWAGRQNGQNPLSIGYGHQPTLGIRSLRRPALQKTAFFPDRKPSDVSARNGAYEINNCQKSIAKARRNVARWDNTAPRRGSNASNCRRPAGPAAGPERQAAVSRARIATASLPPARRSPARRPAPPSRCRARAFRAGGTAADDNPDAVDDADKTQAPVVDDGRTARVAPPVHDNHDDSSAHARQTRATVSPWQRQEQGSKRF